MKIGIRNLLRHDLIGLDVKVVDSINKSLIGLNGKIVDETKNSIEIERDEKVKKIIKSQAVFEIELEGQAYHIDGRLLVGRPEDRIKKVRSLSK